MLLMLADIEGIGTLAIVVIGIVSYVYEHMKKQKAEAEARRQLQHDLQEQQIQRKEQARQAQVRQLEEAGRYERDQPPPVPDKKASSGSLHSRKPAPASPPSQPVRSIVLEEALPNLEAAMPDVEQMARNRMARRVGSPLSSGTPSLTAEYSAEYSAAAALESLNDAEKAALAALRSRTTRTAAAARSPQAREGRHSETVSVDRLNVYDLRKAIIYKEILDQPVALREWGSRSMTTR